MKTFVGKLCQNGLKTICIVVEDGIPNFVFLSENLSLVRGVISFWKGGGGGRLTGEVKMMEGGLSGFPCSPILLLCSCWYPVLAGRPF
jgi:hypothetical protein